MIGKLALATLIGALVGAVVVATAAPELNLRGNRFKPLTYEQLTPEQKAVVDREFAAGRTPGGARSISTCAAPNWQSCIRP